MPLVCCPSRASGRPAWKSLVPVAGGINRLAPCAGPGTAYQDHRSGARPASEVASARNTQKRRMERRLSKKKLHLNLLTTISDMTPQILTGSRGGGRCRAGCGFRRPAAPAMPRHPGRRLGVTSRLARKLCLQAGHLVWRERRGC